jgi:transcriptional regulator GlxA family with amidase domain
MLKHLANPISLANIAAAAGCTERAIVRIFIEYRDAHPMQALSKLRARHALPT